MFLICPLGTEPKLKVYVEVVGEEIDVATKREKLVQQLLEEKWKIL